MDRTTQVDLLEDPLSQENTNQLSPQRTKRNGNDSSLLLATINRSLDVPTSRRCEPAQPVGSLEPQFVGSGLKAASRLFRANLAWHRVVSSCAPVSGSVVDPSGCESAAPEKERARVQSVEGVGVCTSVAHVGEGW
jgi:hypothetical protein